MASKRVRLATVTVALGVVASGALATTVATAGDGSFRIKSRLSGFQEDPRPVSTNGWGEIALNVNRDRNKITYRLKYADLEGDVLQAHIHFGGRAQSGGISAFLCSNLGNGPAGTPACPAPSGVVKGTINADDVIGPAGNGANGGTGQGIEPGEFDELVDAIRAQTTYANVRSSLFPGGEIRSQLHYKG